MTTRLGPTPHSDGREGPALNTPTDQWPILVLYPHNRCNCRCAMCDIWRISKGQSLDSAAIAAQADTWRRHGVKRLVLSGGEPLMHRDLWTMLEPMVDAGMGITLITTGLLLGRHAEPVARFVDDVVVSLDGPPPIHDAVRRVPGAFARMAEGVAAVKARTRAESSPGVPKWTARCTLQRANMAALSATADAALTAGFDHVSFLAVDVASDAFNRPGGWPEDRRAEVAPTSRDMSAFVAAVADLEVRRPTWPPGFIVESRDKLQTLGRSLAAAGGLGPYPGGTCNAPWVSAVVEADGSVRPCFFHAPIGHWDGQSNLMDVLQSPDARAFRDNLDVATNPICRRCTCRLNLAPSENTKGAQAVPGGVVSSPG